MKPTALALALILAAGCDVQPYPFPDDTFGDASRPQLQIRVTPLGSGQWITSNGQAHYACYFDAVATVTGNDPSGWVALSEYRRDGTFGTYSLSTATSGTMQGTIMPGSLWTGLFHPPAPPPAGPGQGLYALAVGQERTISNQWVGSTLGPFTYTADLYFITNLDHGGGYGYSQTQTVTLFCP